jgi:hypothetical protein
MQHWVWQFEWPADIQKELVTGMNQAGKKLTINDLELAGLVLGWLVIEGVCKDFVFKNVVMFCDNTSSVVWAHRGSTSTSLPAARLLRFLALRQRARQASSLLPLHIAGENNQMADILLQAFKNGNFFEAHADLVTYFNLHFPLPQKLSWREFKVPTKWASRVIYNCRWSHCSNFQN